MKRLLLLLITIALVSCADSQKQLNYLKSQYPNCKVEPAAGLIQRDGYKFIVIDSTNQIIAISFYPLSETKISSMRNVR